MFEFVNQKITLDISGHEISPKKATNCQTDTRPDNPETVSTHTMQYQQRHIINWFNVHCQVFP